MNNAIKKAVEGGYAPGQLDGGDSLIKLPVYAKSQIWVDPLFWKALGKAMGWQEETDEYIAGWIIEWHRLIDHLIAGKDADSFFNKLLS